MVVETPIFLPWQACLKKMNQKQNCGLVVTGCEAFIAKNGNRMIGHNSDCLCVNGTTGAYVLN